jgi:hypothetical protein
MRIFKKLLLMQLHLANQFVIFYALFVCLNYIKLAN